MNSGIYGVISLFVLLFICTLDGYSMMNYRVSEKRAYACFFAVTVFCLAVNSYISMRFGYEILRHVILFTIGLPYFALILFITGDKISQTVFNFWLWINIYEIIAAFSAFVNDFTFKNYMFLTFLRFLLFSLYFVFYNRYVKEKHRYILKGLNVNWWIFTFIPMFFTLLIFLVGYFCADRNYPILFVIHILMFLVYILIFYTFKTADDAMEREKMAQNMKDQIALQKKQYEFYLQREEAQRIFRHDMRHRDTVLLGYLKSKNVEKATDLLNREVNDLNLNFKIRFCENILVNAVLTEYYEKAEAKKIEFSSRITVPEKLAADEAEFCVMLSNLLENSIDSAKSYINVNIKPLNRQLSMSIENDYEGRILKDSSGQYLTTKENGQGLGIKSVETIVKNNGGFLEIEDNNGVFCVRITIKN